MNEIIKTEESSILIHQNNWGSSHSLIDYSLTAITGQSNWCSDDIPNSNFSIYFPRNHIKITNYTFVTRFVDSADHPCNWKVEGSNDGNIWEYIDHKTNQKDLNGLGIMKTFEVQKPYTYKHFRFVQNGTNSRNYNYFSLGKIEIFGTLYGIGASKFMIRQVNNKRCSFTLFSVVYLS